jgi:hypothetical protein
MFSKSIYEIFKLLTTDRPNGREVWTLFAFTVVIGVVTVVVTYILVNRIKKETISIDKERAMQERDTLKQLITTLKHEGHI